MEEIRGPAGRTMWDKLGNVNEAVLANYLKNEYPQTVAVVLSKMNPEHAARVLGACPRTSPPNACMRMLRMEPVQREILDKIEQTLRTEFMSNLARTSKRDSHEMMADIFNNFDRQTEARFIAALEDKQPRERRAHPRADVRVRGPVQARPRRRADPAARGREGRPRASRSRAPRTRCARCSSPTCPSAPQDHARGHGGMGPVRLKDVDAAQTRMVAVAKDLAAKARSCSRTARPTTS